jgi:hypothetical protein
MPNAMSDLLLLSSQVNSASFIKLSILMFYICMVSISSVLFNVMHNLCGKGHVVKTC